jgi:hypothetical protein
VDTTGQTTEESGSLIQHLINGTGFRITMCREEYKPDDYPCFK